MRDGEIVAATLAGDPAALLDAYDQYAPGRYGYCRSLLSRPADAADAVQDTFVVAAAKLGGLRDPGRLRPRLAPTISPTPTVSDTSTGSAVAGGSGRLVSSIIGLLSAG